MVRTGRSIGLPVRVSLKIANVSLQETGNANTLKLANGSSRCRSEMNATVLTIFWPANV